MPTSFISRIRTISVSALAVAIAALLQPAASAHALDLDWEGQFWTSGHFLQNYDLGKTGAVAGGYGIPSSDSGNASFQTLFFRLRPRVVVNDNIYLKSEWWFGDPAYSFFGGALGYPSSDRQWQNPLSRGALISGQRYWAEVVTDIGTVRVGRAPLNYGIGLVWNSGDDLFDHFMSTGDLVQLESRFGAFSIIPSFIKYSAGTALGAECTFNPATGLCGVVGEGSSVTDYSLILKYENLDEEFVAGVNFIRRLGDSPENAGVLGPAPVGFTPAAGDPYDQPVVGMVYNTWDIYARKSFGDFAIQGELPLINGTLGGNEYNTYGLGLEAEWKMGDRWTTYAKAGRAQGQPNIGTAAPDNFKAFYFHPGYRLGLILFNYQFNNFAAPNTQNNPLVGENDLVSPFGSQVVNATYGLLGASYTVSKWSFYGNVIAASAVYTAEGGQNFFNVWEREFFAGTEDQGSYLGTEVDFGTRFAWDDNTWFAIDTGVFLPGSFFEFNNATADTDVGALFAGVIRLGIDF